LRDILKRVSIYRATISINDVTRCQILPILSSRITQAEAETQSI